MTPESPVPGSSPCLTGLFTCAVCDTDHDRMQIFAIVQSVVFFPPQQSQTLRVSQIFFMAALGASQVTQILLYRRVFGWATKRLWKNFNSLLVAVCIFAIIPVIVAGLDSVRSIPLRLRPH